VKKKLYLFSHLTFKVANHKKCEIALPVASAAWQSSSLLATTSAAISARELPWFA